MALGSRAACIMDIVSVTMSVYGHICSFSILM